MLLLLSAVAATAAADLLGARLSVGSVVTVESHATIDTTVNLSITGAYTLDETTFPLAPGQIREVEYRGTGRGTVTALMRPQSPTGDANGIQLTAAIVPAVPTTPPLQIPLLPNLILVLLAISALIVSRRYFRNANP